jgi:beta-exotoxin I transport system ATP-binding protein
MKPMQTVIQTSHLTHCYGSRRGITDVSLKIGQGEIFGFLGPNGAGKSTAIRVLLGFLKPRRGTAVIFGNDVWARSHVIKRDVGYVAGDVRLYAWLTLRKALQIVGGVRGMDLMPRGLDLAEQFRLEPDLTVRRMSRGNRQKVALVLALVHQPKLVMLDEPTSGLDPLMQDVLADQLRLLSAMGHTVFFSSHTLSEVETLCTRVAVVRDGHIVADESLVAMKANAPRSVTVTLNDQQSADTIEWPDYLTPVRSHAQQCEFRMTGHSGKLVRWAGEREFTDIAIGQPSLEVMFRRFYDESQEVAT